MLKRISGKVRLFKRSAVQLVTELETKQKPKDSSIKVTVKNSTTSDTIAPEVWIMCGLLSSLGMQIVYASLKDRKK